MTPVRTMLSATDATAGFPPSFQNADLFVYVMGGFFLVILATMFSFLWLIKKQRPATALATAPVRRTPKVIPHHHAAHVLLQGPARWIAVQTTNLPAVLAVLHLRNPRRCSLEEGLAEAREHKLFITPPVQKWILIFGADLPDPADDVDECFHLLRHLSQQLGHVQFFSCHPPVNHHAWAMAREGRIIRAYAWAGKTLWNQGPLTAAERSVGMRCHGYGEEAPGFSPSGSHSNADRLPLLVARWSVNPLSLDQIADAADQGVSGEPSPQRLH